MKIKYLGTGAAEGMPGTFCACPVCLRSLQEGGKSLRMRSCLLLDDDILIDVVSLDCARGLLPGDGLMGWQEVLKLRERLKAIGAVTRDTRFILTHLSHMNDMTHAQWEAFTAPYKIEVAWDGLEC